MLCADKKTKVHFSRLDYYWTSNMNIWEEFFVMLFIFFWAIVNIKCMEYGVCIEVWGHKIFYRWKFKEMFEGRIHWEHEKNRQKGKKIRILFSSICASMNKKTRKKISKLLIHLLKLLEFADIVSKILNIFSQLLFFGLIF